MFAKNRNRFETIITLICCVIALELWLVRDVSALSVTDICEFVTGQQIYCNCDNMGPDEARQVTCFIIETEGLSRSSPVWNGFKLQKNITSLMITTRFDKKMTFLPVSALRNFAQSLEILNVNDMKLGLLDTNSITNFTKLAKINMESNEIRGLGESSYSHLPALKTLSLSSNSIEVLKSKVFIDLPKLEEIFLDRNRLKTIEDNAFIELKSLREIDLRLNEINAITSATFSGLTGLKRLDLSRNALKTIPNSAFMAAPLLRELDLNKNQIELIEENAFQGMTHLMSIQLNENKIKYLSTKILKGSPNLVLTDLSNNQLQTIESDLVDDLQHLQDEQFVFYIRDNPLECDCRLLWLSNTSRPFGQLFKRELKHIKCELKTQFGEFKVGEVIKVLKFGQNESVINACQPNTETEIEEILEVKAENRGETRLGEKRMEENTNYINQSMENIEKSNKIDLETNEYFEAKPHLSESTETVLQNEKSVETSDTNDANDVREPQTTGRVETHIKESRERTERTDGRNGSLSHIHTNTETIILCVFIAYVFCKNHLI